MHGCAMTVASTFTTILLNFTVLGEVNRRCAAFEADSVLFEKGLSFFQGFCSEASAFPEWVWFVVEKTIFTGSFTYGRCDICTGTKFKFKSFICQVHRTTQD